jgi:ferredoxin
MEYIFRKITLAPMEGGGNLECGICEIKICKGKSKTENKKEKGRKMIN